MISEREYRLTCAHQETELQQMVGVVVLELCSKIGGMSLGGMPTIKVTFMVRFVIKFVVVHSQNA